MKRASADEAGNSPKRSKVDSPDPFDPAQRKKSWDICQYGTDGSGFLAGKAFMVWPFRSGLRRVYMETEDDGVIARFDIKLGGKCAKYFDKLDITSADLFEISLKGAEREFVKESSKPYFLPMVLSFSQGVIFKFTKRVRKPMENEVIIDTWKLDDINRQQQAIRPQEEERRGWFSPPLVPLSDRLISDLSVHADVPDAPLQRPETSNSISTRPTNGKLPHSSTPIPKPARGFHPSNAQNALNGTNEGHATSAKRPSNPPPSRAQDLFDTTNNNEVPIQIKPAPKNDTSTTNSASATPNYQQSHSNSATTSTSQQIAVQPSPPVRLTKKQQRMLKKKQREEAAAKGNPGFDQQPAPEPAQFPAPPAPMAPTSVIVEAPPSCTIPVAPPVAPVNVTPSPNPRDPALDVQAGFRTEVGECYVALNELKASSSLINVIGVVTSSRGINPTRSGDLFCSLTLVDPSNLDINNHAGSIDGLGCLVNCFTAKHEGWLPSPRNGDVLLLRGVKASEFNYNMSLVGYKDKLRWAIFNPETGLVHHGDKAGAPDSEGLADGFGFEFSPFWTPKAVELTQCLRLADWWRAVLKVVQSTMGEVHQIGSGEMYSKPRRIHRLISEASPDIPPNGFFDCTVEVIKGFLNDNNVYSLYVTDYTINPKVTPVQGSWCPPELADRILKIEMWDAAGQLGQTMETGEYWFLRNTRMRVNGYGYLEGTMQLADKVRKLNENDMLVDRHLQALLQRKKEWEEMDHSVHGGFDHQLFEDVKKGQFFDCTVEVLHVDYNPNGTSAIYITDYTRHSDLPIVPATNEWSRGLEKQIIKVILWDQQMEMAKALEPGCFYTIRKLRVVQSATNNQFQGRLGGSERLIQKLQAKSTSNDKLVALLKRKELWERNFHSRIEQNRQTEERQIDIPKAYPRPGYHSIRNILANDKLPNKFRLVARIKDFYPLRLEDCVVLRCMQCEEDLRASYKECVKCCDMVTSTVKCLYRFFFRLEDEEGKELVISVADEECSLLQNLDAADLRDDPESLEAFKGRMGPIIGNLVDVHEGILRSERIAPQTPMLELVIDSWKSDGDGISYGLVGVKVIN